MLDRLFGWTEGKEKPAISYEQEREVARHPEAAVREDLARRSDARPEILYFLAADSAAEVRRAVARNPSSPRRADQLLASDSDEEVRMVLARKIGRLVPGLDQAGTERLQEMTLNILSTLADDQLPKVRRIVAEEIKSATNIPPELVARLARDAETVVCAPVLQYSVLLTDDDLLEVVANARDPEVVTSVSRRERLNPAVCDAIVATGQEGAIATLLSNHGAQIREDTLDSIIAAAPKHPVWHRPLVRRPKLSAAAVRRIAGFVAAALLDELAERGDLDPETERFVRHKVKERLKEEDASTREAEDAAAARARMAHMSGQLDDNAISAAADASESGFVEHALALKADLTPGHVRAILRARAPRPLAALCWKAHLTMRTAVSLQRSVFGLRPGEMLNPRGGLDYPLTDEEMAWYLAYFATPADGPAPRA